MERSSSDLAGAGASPPLPALAALFDCDVDVDALERMLLAFTVHPQGAGCERAWLVLWNARGEVLEGRRFASAAETEGDLAEAMGHARRAAPRESAPEQRTRAWSESPDRLEGAVAAAWRGSTLALGDGGEQPGAPWADAARVGVAALRRGARAYGFVVGAFADAASEDTGAARLDWLRVTGDAVLGAQSRALEARRRARQASGLAELARTSVSAINLAEAMHLLARLAAQGTGVRGSAVFRCDDEGALALDVAHGVAAVRDRLALAFLPAAREAVEHRQARSGDRAHEAPGIPAGDEEETSVWAAVPLVAYGRPHGALVVYDGADRHPASPGFERGDLEFLGILADQAALLLEHARQLDDLRQSERRRHDQGVRLRDLDQLAAVGEMAARVAQEARNPLASIAAFAKRAHRSLDEGDPQREYLEVVVRESERLEAMMQEQLQYAALERPRLRMQSLNAVVQEALQRASETLVRRRVRMLKKLAPDLPQLLLDARRIQRVVENVVAFALESVPLGGRIQVESRRAKGFVIVEIAFDGARQGGDLLEHLFVPFAPGAKPGGGAAVGLGVAQQIVREHGGEVRVRGDGEWSTVFGFTLPVTGNEDRRNASERRSSRGERRRRDP